MLFSLASASMSSLVGVHVFSLVSVCFRLTCPPATVASSLSWAETPDLSATSVFFSLPWSYPAISPRGRFGLSDMIGSVGWHEIQVRRNYFDGKKLLDW